MRNRNVGGLDRFARLAAGMILVPAGLWISGGVHGQLAGLALTVVGLIALATGVSGYCPLYVPLGISTAGRSGWAGRMMAACGCMSEQIGRCGVARDRVTSQRSEAERVEL